MFLLTPKYSKSHDSEKIGSVKGNLNILEIRRAAILMSVELKNIASTPLYLKK